MLFISEMVAILPKQQMYQKTAQKNDRNQTSDDDAYDSETLFAKDVVSFVPFFNVDLLNHVDEGQDDSEGLENGAHLSKGDLARPTHALTNVGQNSDQRHHQGSHVEHLLTAQRHILVENAHIDSTNQQKLQHYQGRHTVWRLVHGQDEICVLEGVDFLVRLLLFILLTLFLLFICKLWCIADQFVCFLVSRSVFFGVGLEAIPETLVVAVDGVAHFLDIVLLIRVFVLVVVDDPHLFLGDVVKPKTALRTEREFQVVELVPLHIHEVKLVLDPMLFNFNFLWDQAFGFPQIGRDDDACSFERSPADIAEDLDFDDFSNGVAEAVVFVFFDTNEFLVLFLKFDGCISGENQHHVILQMIFVILAQSAVVHIKNKIDINFGHKFFKIHLNNVFQFGPEIGRNVVSLASLGLDMVDDENLVGEVGDRGEFEIAVGLVVLVDHCFGSQRFYINI